MNERRQAVLALKPHLAWQAGRVQCGTSWLRIGSDLHSLRLRGREELQRFCSLLEPHADARNSSDESVGKFGHDTLTAQQYADRWVNCTVERGGSLWSLALAFQVAHDLFSWFGLTLGISAGPLPEDDYRHGLVRHGATGPALTLAGRALELTAADGHMLQEKLLDSASRDGTSSIDWCGEAARLSIVPGMPHSYGRLVTRWDDGTENTLNLSRTSMVRLAAELSAPEVT